MIVPCSHKWQTFILFMAEHPTSSLSIHLLMDTWVASFRILVIVNNAIMNIEVHVSVQIRVFIFFKYIPRTGIVESLFADDMILFLENFKSPTKKKNSRISEFSKVVRYKIDIQKSVAFLYANKKLSEKSRKESHEKKKICSNKFNRENERPIL